MIDTGKLRVYLDTSVVSHLLQEDVPEKMADTRQLWEMFRTEKYELIINYFSSILGSEDNVVLAHPFFGTRKTTPCSTG